MLLIHETHRLHGTEFYEFESLYRDEWMPAVAGPGVRLLWYFNHAHGTNVSFNVVTITGVRDWEAWQAHAERVRSGSLQALARRFDMLRYGVAARLVQPLEWSPWQEADLDAVPFEPGAEHPLQMYVEDCVHVDGEAPGEGVEAIRAAYPQPAGLAELAGVFRPVFGAGSRRDVFLLQKVLDLDRLSKLYARGEHDGGPPWSAAHGDVPFTDTWATRILRTASWSPLN